MVIPCELCRRESYAPLCVPCADMIQRLFAISERMSTHQQCEAERLAQSAAVGQAASEVW